MINLASSCYDRNQMIKKPSFLIIKESFSFVFSNVDQEKSEYVLDLMRAGKVLENLLSIDKQRISLIISSFFVCSLIIPTLTQSYLIVYICFFFQCGKRGYLTIYVKAAYCMFKIFIMLLFSQQYIYVAQARMLNKLLVEF